MKDKIQVAGEILYAGKDDETIADYYNNFFRSVSTDLAKKILKNNTTDMAAIGGEGGVASSLFLAPVTMDEILRVINSLKSNCAQGSDQLRAEFFKNNKHILLTSLECLINLSFEEGVFPKSLKESIICPIFKAGDKNDVNYYRPISLVNTLAKIYDVY